MRTALRQGRQVVGYIVSHPANRGRRGRQVLRAMLFQVKGRIGLSTVTPIGDRSRMRVELHYSSGSKVVYANPPDWNEMQAWRRILRPGDLFVDVGANVGAYSLWAAERGVEVIAVEPHPQTARQLRRNAALNNYSVDIHEAALADARGSMYLTSGRDSMNHLLADPDEDGIEVAVETLDDIVGSASPVFMKIDVEGAEALVLRGARKAISEGRVLAIQLEWNGLSETLLGQSRESIVDMLSEHGFALYRPTETGDLIACPRPEVGPDVFAVRPEALARLDTPLS